METDTSQISADVCVVGAGIVGLAHAHEAFARGLSVVVLEREHHVVGASVRNFGHLFASALADGEDLELGLRSRERWLELAPRAGLSLHRSGTLLVARAEDELATLEAGLQNPARRGRMLTAAQAAELVPIPTAELVGALHTELDLRTSPRAAVAGLARLLVEQGGRIEWGVQVQAVEPGRVFADRLEVTASAVVICPGPDFRQLPPSVRPQREQMTLCSLQMLRAAAPQGRIYSPALATGLSLIRYPAFARTQPGIALRARYERERPDFIEHGVHLLVTQLPDGDLIIGDTHVYGDTLEPFGEERLYRMLEGEAARLLGERLQIKQRWHGIYPSVAATNPSATGTNFIVNSPMSGVRVVECVSGLGMTLAFGQAPLVLDELLP